MPHPFILIPWDQDFLPALYRCLRDHTDRPGDAVLIFPHQRPKRYFLDMSRRNADIPKPCLLPRMLAVDELFQLWRLEQASYRQIGMLDQVALLFDCVQKAAQTHSQHAYAEHSLAEQLADMDMAHFFPWGVRLGRLLDESFSQNVILDDVPYADVSPFAAALLGSLSSIRRFYVAELESRHWTSPAYDAFSVVNALELPSFLEDRPIFIAGFAELNGCEERLFQYLWTHGAQVCIHSDPGLAMESGTPQTRTGQGSLLEKTSEAGNSGARRTHWASALHRQWLRNWDARIEAAAPHTVLPSSVPRVHFFAGHDLHSQLAPLENNLEHFVPDSVDASALVLSSTDLLMPTLHQIAGRDVNISMGYPLERAPLFHLLESLMRLHENSRHGLAYWKDALELVRHPLLRMLEIEAAPLRDLLDCFEQEVHKGARRIDCMALWRTSVAQTLPASTQERAIPLGTLLFTQWGQLATPADLASALSALCLFLLEHDHSNGGSLWKRFPLDAEILYRLVQKSIPPLRESALAQQAFPQSLLFAVLREMAAAERVPFEADPITGLQVVGMLETRLLHFQHVHILDATDDMLPGVDSQDPLLPEPLRELLGLPTSRERELNAAYNLHRLIAGAQEVFFYWQEGMEAEGRKLRSRYVEEFIWDYEQKAGRILHAGDPAIQTASGSLRPFAKKRRCIEKSPAIYKRMDDLLRRALSPTRLDAYLQCPARFFYQYVGGINPVESVIEGDDPAAVGTLLHSVLQRFYTPLVNRPLCRDDLDEELLLHIFQEELEQSPLRNSLPPDSLIMLRVAGAERLRRFLQVQPEDFEIICLEKKIIANIAIGEKKCMLTGKVDRVDRRADSVWILDYKTGRIPDYKERIWSMPELWDSLEDWTPGRPDPLPDVAHTLCSVQLPFYLHAWNSESLNTAGQAAWVDLADKGEEKTLFNHTMTADLREESIARIETLLHFMLRHMDENPVFMPQEGAQCQWCPYKNACHA